MRNAILSVCGVLAVAATVTTSAQSRPAAPAPAPSTPTMSNARSDDKPVTVTGCLKAWDSSMGATPAAGSAATFVLTNVEAEPGGKSAGPSAATTAAVAAQFLVTADAAVNLAPHLNHKVKIVGKATRPETSAPPKAADPMARPEGASKDAPAMGKDWTTLHATAVTMVAATCPAPAF